MIIGEKRTITIDNLPAGSVCTYSFHLGTDYTNHPTLAVYNFELLQETEGSYKAAVVSN